MSFVPQLQFSFAAFDSLNTTINSGIAPSPHDIDAVLSAVEHDSAELRRLFHVCQSHLSSLEIYKLQLVWMKSGLRTFPTEILALIFENSCFDNEFTSRETTPAVVLSAVCQQWRKIVQSHPQCWSTFSVGRFQTRPRMGEKNLKRLTALFLERSKNAPLNISIDCATTPESVMKSLIRHSDRWKSLQILGPHIIFDSKFFYSKCVQRLSGLECLVFSGQTSLLTTTANAIENILSKFRNFTTVTALKSLCLLHSLSPEARGGFPHWKHITILELHNSSPENVLDTLQACVNAGGALRTVTLSYIAVPQGLGQPNFVAYGSSVILVGLQHLSIFLGSTSTDLRSRDLPQYIFDKLTLPALISLEIHASGQETRSENCWIDSDLFEAFVERSQCSSLAKLCLSEIGIGPGQLVKLLKHKHVSKSLESLTIVETTSGGPRSKTSNRNPIPETSSIASITSDTPSVSASVLTDEFPETLSTVFLQELNLSRMHSSRKFLPKLRKLSLSRSSGVAFDREAFVQAVMSRSKETLYMTGAPLTEVSLQINIPAELLDGKNLATTDVFSFDVYKNLKTLEIYRHHALWITDDDPDRKYERTEDEDNRNDTYSSSLFEDFF